MGRDSLDSPPLQPATNPAHASRADAWGSSDAASALPFQLNPSKINLPKVNRMAVIRSWGSCPEGAASLVCHFSNYLPTFQH